jgi:hypothetical protein
MIYREMRVIFVRRGQFSTYNILVERTQLINDVDVQWDRRIGNDPRLERRVIAADRRRQDRRRRSSPDVDLRGYTVVDMPDALASVDKH